MGRNGFCGVTGNLRVTWGPEERANNASAAVRNSLLFLSFQGQEGGRIVDRKNDVVDVGGGGGGGLTKNHVINGVPPGSVVTPGR